MWVPNKSLSGLCDCCKILFIFFYCAKVVPKQSFMPSLIFCLCVVVWSDCAFASFDYLFLIFSLVPNPFVCACFSLLNNGIRSFPLPLHHSGLKLCWKYAESTILILKWWLSTATSLTPTLILVKHRFLILSNEHKQKANVGVALRSLGRKKMSKNLNFDQLACNNAPIKFNNIIIHKRN